MLPPNPPKPSHRDFDPSVPDPNDDVDMANDDDDSPSTVELSSVEINILIYLYLLESNFPHTAFTLLSESSLPSTALFQHFNPSYPPANGKPVSGKKDQINGATPAVTPGKGPSPVQASFGRAEGKIERGELVRKLWKSLRWEEIERHITPTGEAYKPTCPNAFNLLIPHICPPGYPSAVGNPRTPFPTNLRNPVASPPRSRPEAFPPPEQPAAGPSRPREIHLNDDDETDSDSVAPRRAGKDRKGKKSTKISSRRTSDEESDGESRQRSASPPRRKPGRPSRNVLNEERETRNSVKSPDKRTRRGETRSARWERDNASSKGRSMSRDDSPASTADVRKRKRGDLLAPPDTSDGRSARSSRSPKAPTAPLDDEMANGESNPKSQDNPRWFSDNEIGIFSDHSGAVSQLAWNPSNMSALATGSVDGTCKWFDFASDSSTKKLVSANKPLVLKHTGINSTGKGLTDVSFHPDGTLLMTACQDGVGRLFTPSGTLLSIMSFGRLAMSATKFNPSGDRIISAKHDGTVILWRPGADNNSNLIHIYSNHTKEVSVIAWLDDRVFASGGYDHLIIIQRTAYQSPRYTLKGHTDDITHLEWQPPIPGKAPQDRLLASAADDGYVRIWKLPEYPSDQPPSSRSASPAKPASDTGDGAKAKSPSAIGMEHCIANIQVIGGESTRMSELRWSPAANEERAWVAASAQESGVQLFDANTGERIRTFDGIEGGVSTFCFSPLTLGKNGLGCVAAGGWNGQVCIWDVETGEMLKEYQIEHSKKDSPAVARMEWRKDGVQLAVGSSGKGKTLMTFYTGDLASDSKRWKEEAAKEEA